MAENILVGVFVLIIGFVMLVKGADWFVDGAAGVARKLGIPQLVIGLTIVAMGTSLPEAAVSITAAIKQNAGIAVGNVLGSNVLNILIILGLTALITSVAVQKSTIRIEIPFMLLITLVLLWMGAADGKISRVEGAILWLFFILYLGYLFFLTRKQKEEEVQGEQPMWKLLLCIVGGATVIVVGSNLTVNSAIAIARAVGLSERVIGLTIVALGTSLPELFTSVTAAQKGNADIAIGNIVGSNIFNILFVLGTSALITPLVFEASFWIDGIAAVIAGVVLWLAVVRRKKLMRPWGIVMLVLYAGYLTYILCV